MPEPKDLTMPDLLPIAPGVSAEEAAAATAETLPADHPAKAGVAA